MKSTKFTSESWFPPRQLEIREYFLQEQKCEEKNCELVKKITCLPSIEVSSPCEASRCPKKRIVGGGGVALGDRCPGHGGAHLELKGLSCVFHIFAGEAGGLKNMSHLE